MPTLLADPRPPRLLTMNARSSQSRTRSSQSRTHRNARTGVSAQQILTPAIKSVELPGAVRLPYVEQGDPSGVPLLFLHGVTDSWHSFEPVLPHLSPSIHAFALTQRGHGDAGRPASGYRARDFAADVAAFLDALALGPTVIVGHSMGSTNAQRFAIDHPERTRALV